MMAETASAWTSRRCGVMLEKFSRGRGAVRVVMLPCAEVAATLLRQHGERGSAFCPRVCCCAVPACVAGSAPRTTPGCLLTRV